MIMLALFDFLVGAMAVLAAIGARRKNTTDIFSQLGYLSIALAAFIGTTKFLGAGQLADAHRLVSHAAAIAGVPFAAIAFFLVSRDTKLWASLAAGAGRRQPPQSAGAAAVPFAVVTPGVRRA